MLARETGQPAADLVKLIVPMVQRFIATDRGFGEGTPPIFLMVVGVVLFKPLFWLTN